MSFTFSDVDVSDAENIARHVEVPAMQNGPLYRTMFPRSDTITEAGREEVVRWYCEMLEDAFQDRWESFLKGCSVDGTPVGFCGWTIMERNQPQVKANDGQTNMQPKKATWLPEAIDVDSWIAVSKALRAERDRVLKDVDNVCRLTFMAVNPSYQRQGIASMMMQRICEETDQHGRCAYVLAAPEGVPLYTKFGFRIVGYVETPQGIITSMLRPA
ncbi:acyl-CoA N-acyltransferase [Staphylotrichum tortipilum]|uniref:Acyl-CoA N-acyltransferase n=1 Tax=Staphylotrichum tortipilum TaxID=2831512 RepID=A0AAN6MBG9_9PEZI|nr:acyl-CoA N-acyltransferase [Staphylotrichum longicolle]